MLVLPREKETETFPRSCEWALVVWSVRACVHACVCVCMCVCVCVNAHAHLLDYALSFYSLHIFSADTYVAEITYLSFGRHWCAEKKSKKKLSFEVLQVHQWGAYWRKSWSRVCELDDEKVCEIWMRYTTENVSKKIFLKMVQWLFSRHIRNFVIFLFNGQEGSWEVGRAQKKQPVVGIFLSIYVPVVPFETFDVCHGIFSTFVMFEAFS